MSSCVAAEVEGSSVPTTIIGECTLHRNRERERIHVVYYTVHLVKGK